VNSNKYTAIALGLLIATSCSASPPLASDHIGFWRMVSDEDNGPLGDVFELRSDGNYIVYDPTCAAFPGLDYHIHKGNIYVTSVIPDKGPVAVIFHPESGGKLSFTSPRTRNRAWYERIPAGKCVRRS
jgi:hypothetical protein